MYDRDSHSSCDHLGHCETVLYCNSRVGKVIFVLCTEFQHDPKTDKVDVKSLCAMIVFNANTRKKDRPKNLLQKYFFKTKETERILLDKTILC